MTTIFEFKETFEAMETRCHEGWGLARDSAGEVHNLENALEEEQETRVALEERLESSEELNNEVIAKLTKEHDHAIAKCNVLSKENAKLNNELVMLSHSISNINDACATNSTLCEASILKENVELRAQLELLSSKYGKLEGNHEKLSSSNDDLLASHARLEVALEAISTKVKSCEPLVITSTISSKNTLLPCASSSNSSTHNIVTSCDELLSMPCCSNNVASTSSSICVDTNHVEEIKELKAQVYSLKNDLVKSHEGKCKLDKMLSVQQSLNDKSGLGFNSNNKNKSKNNKNETSQPCLSK
jgi:chromosome segregation ATPase